MKRNEHGFSLIELLIVVLIIGVLAAIAIIGYAAVMRNIRSNSQPTRLSKYINAQAEFRTAKGKRRYATFQELRDSNLIDDSIAVFNPKNGNQTAINEYIVVPGNEDINFLRNNFQVNLDKVNREANDTLPNYCVAADGVIRRGNPIICDGTSTPVQ